MKQIIVGIAEGKIARKGEELIAYALGSCVGVCLYDPKKKLGGMAHIVLPHNTWGLNHMNPYKFADEGIEALKHEMIRCGAKSENLIAKIAGGAKMFQSAGKEWEIGERNIYAVKAALQREGIRLYGEDTGRDYGRTIRFSTDDGKLTISTVKKKVWVL